MIAPLIISLLLSPLVYYCLKLIAKLRKKKKVDGGIVLVYTFLIVNIAWIGAFIMSFVAIGGIAGEMAFLFIGIPVLIVLFGLCIGS